MDLIDKINPECHVLFGLMAIAVGYLWREVAIARKVARETRLQYDELVTKILAAEEKLRERFLSGS